MANDKIRLLIEAQNRTGDAFNQVNRNVSKLEKNVANLRALGNVFTGLFGASQAIGFAQDVARIADEWNNVAGRLKLVTDNSEELEQVQDDLYQLSQRTSSSYKATADLYSNIRRNADQLGLSNKELLDLTESINKSIQVSGTSSASAEAAITQLNQALGSGVLRGDEFNSIMEQAPRLSQALADGLGVPIGALREMAQAGELTADRVTKALLDQKEVIDREFGELPNTVEKSMQKIGNSIGKFVNEIDKTTGASNEAANSLVKIADSLDYLTGKIDQYSDALKFSFDYIDEVKHKFDAVTNPVKYFVDELLKGDEASKELAKSTENLTEKQKELAQANDEVTESEYAKQFAQEKELEIQEAQQQKVDEVIQKLKEESHLLTLSAKDQFIYNQLKKTGKDITEEQAESIKEAAEALFDEKEAAKAATKQIRQTTQAKQEYIQAEKQGDSDTQSIGLFGKAAEEAEETKEKTEEATEAQREWFSAVSGEGPDTSDAFEQKSLLSLTPEQARVQMREVVAAAQDEANKNPVQVPVAIQGAKSNTKTDVTVSDYIDPLLGGGSGLSAVSLAEEALKQGGKA
jgi:tape measure domain-containing protein